MKFLEAIAVVEEARNKFDEKWDCEGDGWALGARTKFMVVTHKLADLRTALESPEEDKISDEIASLAAACIYWLESDFQYASDEDNSDKLMSKSPSSAYL